MGIQTSTLPIKVGKLAGVEPASMATFVFRHHIFADATCKITACSSSPGRRSTVARAGQALFSTVTYGWIFKC